MRHASGTHAASTLCLWALLGLAAHAGATQVVGAARGEARGEASVAASSPGSRCAGSSCTAPAAASAAAAAWPYRGADGEDTASRPVRRVRVIALDAAPSTR